MASVWTSHQVLSLSPDAGSTKRGRALAKLAKWSLLGQSEGAVWGECQGSGQKPYRTVVDLGTVDLRAESGEPAFRCSCPSRKFPCKHVLGLLLLWTQTGAYELTAPPVWVTEWLEKRANNAQRAKDVSPQPPTDSTDNLAAIEKKNQQAKQRLARRSEKVAEGLVDLDQWLCDILRAGLADLPNQPYSFWDQAAARLIDAQAPGLARRIKELASIPHSGKGWPERMLKALGRLYLLAQSFGRLAQLSPMMQAEVLKQIGFPQNKDDLQRRADAVDPLVISLSDTWQVLGKVVTEEESLKTQRVWLWGMNSQKPALVLSFAHGRRQPLDVSLVPGASFVGRLIFYPGTGVQRALVVSRAEATNPSRLGLGSRSVEDAIAQYTTALSENPWLVQFPMILAQVWLHCQAGKWYLQDENNRQLPVSPLFEAGWEMLAMSGGRSLSVFGEWDGDMFSPLSAWSEKTFVMLGGEK